MSNEKLQFVIEALRELEADAQVSKNIKVRITNTIKTLEEVSELSIRISRALSELEEITEDTNMQSFTRTQLFNIVSMLEMMNTEQA